MKRYDGRDLGLSVRMAAAWVALGFLYLPLLAWLVLFAYGWAKSSTSGALTAIGALGFLAAVPFLSERATLLAAGARGVHEGDEPLLAGTVERLSALADLPAPRLGIVETAAPNAFSAGRSPRNSIIVVTRGLLERLNARELEAVLAHELAHVANRDAFVMTLAGAPAHFFRKLVWGLARLPWTARGVRKVPAAIALLYLTPVLFVGWIAYALMALVLMSLSRYREQAADRGAALLTGAPEQLMSALQRIAQSQPLIPRQDLRTVGSLSAFWILPPRAAGGFEVDPLHMFPTHPPLAERLERLATLSQRLGQPVRLPHAKTAPPAVQRGENPQAMLALVLAMIVWTLLVCSAILQPDPFGGGMMLVGIVGSAAAVGGIVLGFQGVGRASSGNGYMGYAVASLAMLLGPWVLGMAALAVLMLLAGLGLV